MRVNKLWHNFHFQWTIPFSSSHHKLWLCFSGQVPYGQILSVKIQRKILAGSLNGKCVLVIPDTGTLVRKSLVPTAAGVPEVGFAAERITVRGVLAKLRPLLTVPLEKTNIIQWLAVSICRVLPLPAHCRLGKTFDALASHSHNRLWWAGCGRTDFLHN